MEEAGWNEKAVLWSDMQGGEGVDGKGGRVCYFTLGYLALSSRVLVP